MGLFFHNKFITKEELKKITDSVFNSNSADLGFSLIDAISRREESNYKAGANSPVRSSLAAINLATGNQDIFLLFHVLKQADHDFSVDVTQYPVDNDTSIADNKVLKNPTFSIDVMFSEASFPLLKSGSKGVTYDKVSGIVSSNEVIVTEGEDQVSIYQKLQEIRQGDFSLTLTTPLGVFDNLIMTGLSFPKGIDLGRSLHCNMRFEQIRKAFVSTTTIKVAKKPKDDSKHKATETKDDGVTTENPNREHWRVAVPGDIPDATSPSGVKFVRIGVPGDSSRPPFPF